MLQSACLDKQKYVGGLLMKKVLAIFMVLAMLAGCVALAACGKKDNNDPTEIGRAHV